jgi:hypothetical protein
MKTNLIDAFGGTSATAEIFIKLGYKKVTPQLVSNWRTRYGDIPPEYRYFLIENRYEPKIMLGEIYPELFGDLPNISAGSKEA